MNRQTSGTSRWKRAGSGLGTLALAALLATPAEAAEVLDDDEPEPQETSSRSNLEFSATGTLATDYVNKGVSQTDRGPAVQASFDIGYHGFYLGAWTSNVDFGGDTTASGETVDVANFEIDFYAGIKKKIDRVTVELGAIYYHYPNSFAPEASFDYVDYKAAVGVEVFRSIEAELKALYSPDYSGGLGKTLNVEGKLTQSLRRGFEVSGALGYFVNRDDLPILADGATEYWYWNAGVSKTFKERYTLDVRYWDTGGTSECRQVTLFQCDARVVGQLSASF